MDTYRRSLSRKVEFARDVLVRCIQDHHLKAGDRLPSYSQLREDFGLGGQTVAAAAGVLCELGVLEVRDKVGIFVKNPNGGHLVGRNIGLLVRNLQGSAYAALLACYLQQAIGDCNCQCLVFYQQSDPDEVPRPGFDDFPGLEQAVNDHRLDGVITLCLLSEPVMFRLKHSGVKYSYIGDDDRPAPEVATLISVRNFLADAKNVLEKECHCSRVVQFCVDKEQAESRNFLMPAMLGSGYRGGAELVDKIMSLNPDQRPDGIVSDDDTVVNGFLAELIRRAPFGGIPEYFPWVATIVHKQVGQLYSSGKTVLYELDVKEYAKLAIRHLMTQLRERKPVTRENFPFVRLRADMVGRN